MTSSFRQTSYNNNNNNNNNNSYNLNEQTSRSYNVQSTVIAGNSMSAAGNIADYYDAGNLNKPASNEYYNNNNNNNNSNNSNNAGGSNKSNNSFRNNYGQQAKNESDKYWANDQRCSKSRNSSINNQKGGREG